MINPEQSNIEIWLVWTLTTSNNLILNAVCLTNKRAVQYRRMLLADENPTRVRVWIEQSQANHLYASLMQLN